MSYQDLLRAFETEVLTSFEDVVGVVEELSEYDNRKSVESAIGEAIHELETVLDEIESSQATRSYERVREALEESSDFGYVSMIDDQTITFTDLNNDMNLRVEISED